ncbi:ATP-dependent metallopeptidase FtsH/Yme1/Tma family protein [Streptomyces lydicus]|uniref:ATP-dependent metallopeptidase FtsH/Yme1/Tma family protein n=1 Tax=Streptomyces lydicus TaxID=47763 RepID=UPI0036C5B771
MAAPPRPVIVFLVLLMRFQSPPGTSLSYSRFLGKVDAGQVKTVDINDKGSVNGTLVVLDVLRTGDEETGPAERTYPTTADET